MRKPAFSPATVLALWVSSQMGACVGASDSVPPRVSGTPAYDSPTSLVATEDGRQLFIACATANQVAVFDVSTTRVAHRIDVPAPPLGLALSKDGAQLYAACAAPSSTICVIDVASRRVVRRLPAGHTAMAPVLSPDGQRLYVCNRFDNDVSVIDLAAGREAARVPVEREPVAAAITPDGRCLVVANHLHAGRSDHLHAQAVVSVIDTTAGRVVKNIPLGLGATLLRGVAMSPDGRFAAVTFVHARFWLSTTEVALGRMNANAVAVLDLNRLSRLGLVFLDQTARGAANPWAVAWAPDGKTLAVSLAGTHEVCLIDAPVDADPANFFSPTLSAYFTEDGRVLPPPAHPVRVRQRVALPGNGPRALAVAGSRLYVANYFSDDLCRLELSAPSPRVETWALSAARESCREGECPHEPHVPGSQHEPSDGSLAWGSGLDGSLTLPGFMAAERVPRVSPGCQEWSAGEPSASLARKGEMLFNDARLCLEGWQSCASCHDTDARADGFNWDLLNDGLENPKNTKSLLWAHQTPPAMSLGVRTNAEAAVRAGLHHILFADPGDEVPAAIEAYLRSLAPMPGPRRLNGRLSPAAERGERLFLSARTGCANCHPPPLFTDLASYDVGTAGVFQGLYGAQAADRPTDRFDTPGLTECWRTAPYLHNGSAATLREVLTTLNPGDRHGRTSQLTNQELDDLVEYLLSL
jgi:YVTN family beta-propeller protein